MNRTMDSGRKRFLQAANYEECMEEGTDVCSILLRRVIMCDVACGCSRKCTTSPTDDLTGAEICTAQPEVALLQCAWGKWMFAKVWVQRHSGS